MAVDRISWLNALIKFSEPISTIETALNNFEWDCAVRLVTLLATDLRRVLERYANGELSARDVETWANLVEGREDIEIEENDRVLLFELANPELTQQLSRARALEILRKT